MTTIRNESDTKTRSASLLSLRTAGDFIVREAVSRDLLSLHRWRSDRYPFLLESAAAGTRQGRFDILFAFPEERLTLRPSGRLERPGPVTGDKFLDALDNWWDNHRIRSTEGGLPFGGGWFLCLGYELAGEIEPTLKLHQPAHQPIAIAVRIPAALIRDREQDKLYVIAEPGRESLIQRICKDLDRSDDIVLRDIGPALQAPLVEDPPDAYLSAIERTKRYIVDGDIFQANLSRQWFGHARPGLPSAEIYRRLRSANPGSFAGIAVFDEMTVISSSPERLLQVRGDIVQTRPIAGTRPRGTELHRDVELSRELIAHPKERAEHIMLIDLERNDLGRICRPGTIEVNEMMVVESFAHVHHIVSNVRGRLRPGITPGAAVRAVFPGGTITGCPKIRCMEIIDELEQTARGPYTGSMGYLNRDGSMDLNILIRTIVRSGDEIGLRAGGGIVADSDPEHELAETRAKAKGLIRALEDRPTSCG